MTVTYFNQGFAGRSARRIPSQVMAELSSAFMRLQTKILTSLGAKIPGQLLLARSCGQQGGPLSSSPGFLQLRTR